MPSKFATFDCGTEPATIEVTDTGEIVLHYEPLETELALDALGDPDAVSTCTRLYLFLKNHKEQPVTLEHILTEFSTPDWEYEVEDLYRVLIELGVDVNAKGFEAIVYDMEIPTAVLVAPVIDGNKDLVEMLLEAGANPNLDDGYLLQEAGDEIGKMLIEYGLDPDNERAIDGLSAAAAFGDMKIIKAALDAGASSILEMLSPAAQLGHLEVVRAILNYPTTNTAHVELAWRDATRFKNKLDMKPPVGEMDGGKLEGNYWDTWVWGEGPGAAIPLLDAWLEEHPHDEDE